MASGDHCQYGMDATGRPDGTAIHWDCDDYPDGTVVDLRTDEVIGHKQVKS